MSHTHDTNVGHVNKVTLSFIWCFNLIQIYQSFVLRPDPSHKLNCVNINS